MKKIEELNKRKVPVVLIDPSIYNYGENVLFPDMLAKANELIKTEKLPKKKRRS